VKTLNSGDSLVIEGRSSTRWRWRSKSKTCDGMVVKSFRCYHYKKECHTRKYCPLRQRGGNSDIIYEFGKQFNGPSTSAKVAIVEDNYESSKVLMVSSSAHNYEWILDFSCSFHMTPNCLWF